MQLPVAALEGAFRPLGAFCLAGALFVAGCQPEAPASLEAGAQRADSAAVVLEDASAPEVDWTVTPDGAGTLRVGAAVEEPAATIGTLEAFGARQAEGDCWHVRPAEAPDGVLAMITGNVVVRVEVAESGVVTGEGVGVGSDLEAVRRAYGDQLAEEPHKYTDGRQLVVDAGADRQIVFETDADGTVLRYRAGRTPEVGWIEGCA